MYETYKDRVMFLLVYVREAHPTDGWVHVANEQEGIRMESAKSDEQKEGYASSCVRNLGIKFTTLTDGLDYKVETDYTAWPDRLYLVSKDGRIAYKSGPGPGGFHSEELEAAIRAELAH